MYTVELFVYDDETDGRYDADTENDSSERRGEATQSLTLTVLNVAPSFVLAGPTTVVEGTLFCVHVSAARSY